MIDDVRRALAELIQRHGSELGADDRRVESLLREQCGTYRREISLLVGAVREGVPRDLLDPTSSEPLSTRRTRLVQRLRDDLAITAQAAEWAVDTWSDALGLTIPRVPTMTSPSPRIEAAPVRRSRGAALLVAIAAILGVAAMGVLLLRPSNTAGGATTSQATPRSETTARGVATQTPASRSVSAPVPTLKISPYEKLSVCQGDANLSCYSARVCNTGAIPFNVALAQETPDDFRPTVWWMWGWTHIGVSECSLVLDNQPFNEGGPFKTGPRTALYLGFAHRDASGKLRYGVQSPTSSNTQLRCLDGLADNVPLDRCVSGTSLQLCVNTDDAFHYQAAAPDKAACDRAKNMRWLPASIAYHPNTYDPQVPRYTDSDLVPYGGATFKIGFGSSDQLTIFD